VNIIENNSSKNKMAKQANRNFYEAKKYESSIIELRRKQFFNQIFEESDSK